MVQFEKKVLIGIYNITYIANQPIRRIKLVGLEESFFYKDSKGIIYSGTELVYLGYLINNNTCGVDHFSDAKVGEAELSSSLIQLEVIN